jgi:spermidine synthase
VGLEERSTARLATELAVTSTIVLLLELALIRWLPSQVRVIAYFPNLVLLSAFLGLGLGCLRAGRRSLLPYWPMLLVAIVASAIGLSKVIFTQNSVSEHLYLLYYDLPPDSPVINDVRPPIILVFLLTTLVFVPLGQLVAERLEAFARRGASLAGYCWDILGSLLGVITFTLLSFQQTRPLVWFSVVLVGGALFFVERRRLAVIYVLGAALTLGAVSHFDRAESYSPYYALSTRPSPPGFTLMTNGSLHQYPIPLARRDALPPGLVSVRDGYHAPYERLLATPRRALVVGAGTGNDVAVLLDRGVAQIDAVEIDPVILQIGRRYHPNRPYSAPGVHTINDDARSFLNRSDLEPYDLIVFGTLDSMTRLSALSNVRLDNFVYTEEAIRAARRHLSSNGGLVLYFMTSMPEIDLRFFAMLTRAFGEAPLVLTEYRGLFNRVYMAGPAFAYDHSAERRAQAASIADDIERRLEIPSDDWPYLYLAHRGVSGFYLSLMAFIALAAAAGVFLASREMRTRRLRDSMDIEMFLFGLAFLLLETRSVTHMNLVWGATWLTSGIVFNAVLLMVLLATLLARWRPLSLRSGWVGLIVALLVAYFLPERALLVSSVPLKLALSLLFVGVPIFFAASCFALLYRQRSSVATAFGWNVLGATAGGLCEVLSMAFGLKALLLLALVAYLGALLLRLRRAMKPATAAAPATSGGRA